jgi:hypothetical protein
MFKLINIKLAKLMQMKHPYSNKITNKMVKSDSITIFNELTTTATTTTQNKELNHILKQIVNDLNYLKKSIQKDDDEEISLLDWKFASCVIDRFLFLITFIYLIISFICIIVTAKNFFKFY